MRLQGLGYSLALVVYSRLGGLAVLVSAQCWEELVVPWKESRACCPRGPVSERPSDHQDRLSGRVLWLVGLDFGGVILCVFGGKPTPPPLPLRVPRLTGPMRAKQVSSCIGAASPVCLLRSCIYCPKQDPRRSATRRPVGQGAGNLIPGAAVMKRCGKLASREVCGREGGPVTDIDVLDTKSSHFQTEAVGTRPPPPRNQDGESCLCFGGCGKASVLVSPTGP